ncbi:uncharacterized protein [Nicotiana tomentosiformis]|uniref:uncharacterized protein n=1 Tax=Nicotiana tomentosiformis TaxID=4098 RepID=UPI00388C64CE
MLSHGGRSTLIKHVLQSMPIYLLSAVSPPKTIMKQIEKLAANFFWGMEDNKRKYHWASWHKLCFPMNEGGLGFRTIEDICKSMEYKQWWHFISTQSLWSSFLKAKYCQRSNPISKNGIQDNHKHVKDLLSTRKKRKRTSNGDSILETAVFGGITSWGQVVWKKPSHGLVKINSDGSALTNPGKIGAGVIIRDHNCGFIHAIAAPLGKGANNLAEIEAALLGIQWCLSNGYSKIHLKSDSALLVQWLNNGKGFLYPMTYSAFCCYFRVCFHPLPQAQLVDISSECGSSNHDIHSSGNISTR